MLVCGSRCLTAKHSSLHEGAVGIELRTAKDGDLHKDVLVTHFFLKRDKDVALNQDAWMLKDHSSTIRRKPIALKPETGIRRYDRKGFDQQVFVQDEQGWEIPLDSMDLSASGMFVKSSALFEVGEMHTLHFEHSDGSPLRVEAKVVRVCSPSPSLVDDAGMGYEFQDIDERTYDALCECVVNM